MSPARRGESIWPDLYTGVPDKLQAALAEPAFGGNDVTFCIWRLATSERWSVGPVAFPRGRRDPDGLEQLLVMLDDRPATYVAFARDYREVELDVGDIARVYAGEELTPELVRALDPSADIGEIMTNAKAMGVKTSSRARASR